MAAPDPRSDAAVLVFDGDCGFCSAVSAWASRAWSRGERTVAWQSLGDDGLGQLGLTSVEVRSAAWWLDTSGRRWRGHQAVGKALEAGGGWRRCAATLVMAPATSWMAAGIYQVVVRYRHLLPGATAACGAPRS